MCQELEKNEKEYVRRMRLFKKNETLPWKGFAAFCTQFHMVFKNNEFQPENAFSLVLQRMPIVATFIVCVLLL